jgi:hypothetical protein
MKRCYKDVTTIKRCYKDVTTIKRCYKDVTTIKLGLRQPKEGGEVSFLRNLKTHHKEAPCHAVIANKQIL